MPSPSSSSSGAEQPPSAGWSLERKLPLLISALLACVVGAFGAASYHQMRGASVEHATTRLQALADQLATMSATGSAPRLAVLHAVAADSLVVRALADTSAGPIPDAVATRLLIAYPRTDSTVAGWELWTAAGARRFRTGPPRVARDSVVLAATRAAAVHGDSVQRSAFYHVGGRVAMWTVMPITAGGRTLGVLAERRRLATAPRTEQMIRQLTGEDVAVRFTSRGADEWASVGGAPIAAPFVDLPDNAPVAASVADVSRVRVVHDSSGTRHLLAQATIPLTPWIIALSEPEQTVLRRPREFLGTLLGVGLLVLAAGAVGAWLLGRHVTRPLRTITHAAAALAGGDYGQRVAVAGSAEAAQLAATFNAMAAGLGQAHAALEERNVALQRANNAKGQFLAMMSHELRTPLNAIGGYTELMELGLRGPVTPAQVEDLVRIRRNKDHLLSIITDILGFARADAGHLTLTLGPVPLNEVLTDVEAVLGPQFAMRGVHLQIAPAAPDAIVHADREKLQQVLVNLLTNALRFTPTGGTVAVANAATSAGMRLTVRDTGVGIPADRLEAIFEPFVQVDSGLTRQVGGTGLGLAIVRTLVGAMGGRVTVESVVGEGSTFTITLPRVAASLAARLATPPGARAAERA